ncbi:hypothetical protein AHAS_Ahas12G0090700 [Arachis hypogaea]
MMIMPVRRTLLLKLIPVEFDSATTEDSNQSRYKANGDNFILDFDTSDDAKAASVIENWHISEEKIVAGFSCQENTKAFKVNEIESIQLQEEEQHLEQDCQDVKIVETIEDLHKDDNAEPNMERRDGESCSDVSTGHEKLEEFVEFKTMSLEVRMPTVNNHFSESSEIHENEEEMVVVVWSSSAQWSGRRHAQLFFVIVCLDCSD